MAEADSRVGARAAHAVPFLRDFSHQARRAGLAHLEPRFPPPVAGSIGVVLCRELSTAARLRQLRGGGRDRLRDHVRVGCRRHVGNPGGAHWNALEAPTPGMGHAPWEVVGSIYLALLTQLADMRRFCLHVVFRSTLFRLTYSESMPDCSEPT